MDISQVHQALLQITSTWTSVKSTRHSYKLLQHGHQSSPPGTLTNYFNMDISQVHQALLQITSTWTSVKSTRHSYKLLQHGHQALLQITSNMDISQVHQALLQMNTTPQRTTAHHEGQGHFQEAKWEHTLKSLLSTRA